VHARNDSHPILPSPGCNERMKAARSKLRWAGTTEGGRAATNKRSRWEQANAGANERKRARVTEHAPSAMSTPLSPTHEGLSSLRRAGGNERRRVGREGTRQPHHPSLACLAHLLRLGAEDIVQVLRPVANIEISYDRGHLVGQDFSAGTDFLPEFWCLTAARYRSICPMIRRRPRFSHEPLAWMKAPFPRVGLEVGVFRVADEDVDIAGAIDWAKWQVQPKRSKDEELVRNSPCRVRWRAEHMSDSGACVARLICSPDESLKVDRFDDGRGL